MVAILKKVAMNNELSLMALDAAKIPYKTNDSLWHILIIVDKTKEIITVSQKPLSLINFCKVSLRSVNEIVKGTNKDSFDPWQSLLTGVIIIKYDKTKVIHFIFLFFILAFDEGCRYGTCWLDMLEI